MAEQNDNYKDTKIAYLLEENKQLREQILDLQIRAGHISLKGEE